MLVVCRRVLCYLFIINLYCLATASLTFRVVHHWELYRRYLEERAIRHSASSRAMSSALSVAYRPVRDALLHGNHQLHTAPIGWVSYEAQSEEAKSLGKDAYLTANNNKPMGLLRKPAASLVKYWEIHVHPSFHLNITFTRVYFRFSLAGCKIDGLYMEGVDTMYKEPPRLVFTRKHICGYR